MTKGADMTATLTLTRRGFLATGAAVGAAAMLSPRLAFASPQDPTAGDVVVLVFLRGGADGLSLVAPWQMASYHDKRPNIAVADEVGPPTRRGLALRAGGNVAAFDHDGTFALHPAMSALHDGPWAAGDLAIVHAAGLPASESASRSHFESMRYIEHGSAHLGVNTGFLNRYLDALGGNTALSAVGVGGLVQRSISGSVSALSMNDPAAYGVSGFGDVAIARNVLERWYGPSSPTDVVKSVGRATFAGMDALEAVDWDSPAFAVQNAAQYPSTKFGRELGYVAKLIRSNIGLKVACVDFGSWDTHDDMGTPGGGGWFDRLAGELSAGLAAFHRDLGSSMGEVSLVTVSEFGRTIDENGTGGTDHGRGSVMFAMGGGIRGGVHGSFVEQIQDGPEDDLTVLNDYRSVLSEILTVRGGLPSTAAVFPTWAPQPALGVCEAPNP